MIPVEQLTMKELNRQIKVVQRDIERGNLRCEEGASDTLLNILKESEFEVKRREELERFHKLEDFPALQSLLRCYS